MQGFSSTSLSVSTSDGRNFVLLEAFSYTTAAGEVITVPAGSQSDGASTPAVLWPTIPPFGKYWRAAYLHDFGYRYDTRPKAFWDSILREAMQWLGCDALLCDTVYEGVNWGGASSFDQDRAAQLATTGSL